MVRCRTCYGRPRKSVPCNLCNGAGSTQCTLCEGRGFLGRIEDGPNPTQTEPEDSLPPLPVQEVELLRIRLRDLEPRLRDVLSDLKSSELRFRGVKAKVELLRQSLRYQDPELESASKRLDSAWTDCGVSLEEAKEQSTESQTIHARIASTRKWLGDPGRTIRIDNLKEVEGFAFTAEQSVVGLDKSVSNLKHDLSAAEEALRSATETLKKVEERQKLRAATERAYAAAQGKITGLAEEFAFPAFQIELAETTTSPTDLHITASYLDRGASTTSDPPSAALTEALLSVVPEFLTRVFRTSPSVGQIELVVSANKLDADGHSTRTPIDRFRVTDQRWGRLMSGEYKNDWRRLLSEIDASPMVGGGESTASASTILFLIGLLFAGLVVAVVARMAILR
jgi:hypothetical protein